MDAPKKTTLIDIYEAAGGTVNEDRSQVTMDGTYKPFTIQLDVFIKGVSMTYDEPDKVTLGVVLSPDVVSTPSGTFVSLSEVDLDLPVTQIHIVKES